MKTDTLVDLKNDNIGNTNLFEETSCFNTMGITFKADSTFITNNSRLDFNAALQTMDSIVFQIVKILVPGKWLMIN